MRKVIWLYQLLILIKPENLRTGAGTLGPCKSLSCMFPLIGNFSSGWQAYPSVMFSKGKLHVPCEPVFLQKMPPQVNNNLAEEYGVKIFDKVDNFKLAKRPNSLSSQSSLELFAAETVL
ncbi:hypothetical protein L6164_031314 [Bauhinia variegata]|uniref:Uncharacterized protein n=1 Tax=Bauhinia variegata TaxID=167791 RepID=A0ACB9LEL3_BAUVA|nr:hypothetical protein L6164_031314 [Bauhinia variegata]